jgi:hypothetical protein
MFKHHVIEQDPAVRDVDVERILHRFRGQPDLPANHLAPLSQLGAVNRVLHSISVVHPHLWVLFRKQSYLFA